MPSDMRMIGPLLYDSKMIFEDLLASWENGSWKAGIQGETSISPCW
jgi:sulfate adenylyltransferase subunit 1 (EFTu-like GTPase family)